MGRLQAERQELCEFIRDQAIEDVSFVTGDIHTFFAGDVASSGRASTTDPSVATEFVAGAITSEGIADKYGDGALVFPADSVVMADNPHIKFSNQQYKGYGGSRPRRKSCSCSTGRRSRRRSPPPISSPSSASALPAARRRSSCSRSGPQSVP